MKGYKLVSDSLMTRDDTQWVVGERKDISPVVVANNISNPPLCSNAWFHYFRSPVMAIMQAPVYFAAYWQRSPRLFECITYGQHKHDGQFKSGCRGLMLTEEITHKYSPLTDYCWARVSWTILCRMKQMEHTFGANVNDLDTYKLMQAWLTGVVDLRSYIPTYDDYLDIAYLTEISDKQMNADTNPCALRSLQFNLTALFNLCHLRLMQRTTDLAEPIDYVALAKQAIKHHNKPVKIIV